jgi:acyl-CoA synthetase (NDP forming)
MINRTPDARHLITLCNNITDQAFDMASRGVGTLRGRDLHRMVNLALAFSNFKPLCAEMDAEVYP